MLYAYLVALVINYVYDIDADVNANAQIFMAPETVKPFITFI